MSKEVKESKELISKDVLIAQFKESKVRVAEICDTLDKMLVTDNESCEAAVDLGTKANKLMKSVDERRIVVKAPFWDTCTTIDGIAKEITGPLKKSIDAAKSKVLQFKSEEEERKAQDIRRLQEERENANKNGVENSEGLKWMINFVDTSYQHLLSIFENEKDPASARVAITQLLTFPSASTFGAHVATAKLIHSSYKDVALSFIEYLKGNSPEKKRLFVQNQLTLKNLIQTQVLAVLYEEDNAASMNSERKNIEIVSEMIQVSESKSAGSTRDNWTFEIADFGMIPLQFLIVDEKAINEWIKANKEAVVSGSATINGIKFVNKPIVVFK